MEGGGRVIPVVVVILCVILYSLCVRPPLFQWRLPWLGFSSSTSAWFLRCPAPYPPPSALFNPISWWPLSTLNVRSRFRLTRFSMYDISLALFFFPRIYSLNQTFSVVFSRVMILCYRCRSQSGRCAVVFMCSIGLVEFCFRDLSLMFFGMCFIRVCLVPEKRDEYKNGKMKENIKRGF